MTILPAELTPLDIAVARRVLARAVTIAPCLHSLDGEAREQAIAILCSVGESLTGTRPAQHIRQKRAGQWTVEYATDDQIASAFTVDDCAALAALCGSVRVTGPVGRFPEPSTRLLDMWPERS